MVSGVTDEVPTAEPSVAGKHGSLELAGVSSPSEAVLDYYELEGRREANIDLCGSY